MFKKNKQPRQQILIKNLYLVDVYKFVIHRHWRPSGSQKLRDFASGSETEKRIFIGLQLTFLEQPLLVQVLSNPSVQ